MRVRTLAAPLAAAGAIANPAACFPVYRTLERAGRIIARPAAEVPGGLVATRVPARFAPLDGAVVLTHRQPDPDHSPGVTEFYVRYPQRRPPETYGPFEAIDGGTGSLPVYFDDGRVRVVSDVPLTRAEAQNAAKKIEDAYAFDQRQLRWTDPISLAQEPITFRLLSQRAMGQFFPKDAGAALGLNAFVMGTGAVDSPGAAGIFAHEVSHLQSTRAGGGMQPWAEEGKAGLVQRMYLRRKGLPLRHPAGLGAITRQRALDVLERYTFPKQVSDGEAEPVSAFFVEFIRTRLSKSGTAAARPGDGDFPDAAHRFARVVERIAPMREQWVEKHPGEKPTDALRHQWFANAFHAEFGMWVADARAQFGDWLDATQPLVKNDPDVRFRGTLFENTSVTRE